MTTYFCCVFTALSPKKKGKLQGVTRPTNSIVGLVEKICQEKEEKKQHENTYFY